MDLHHSVSRRVWRLWMDVAGGYWCWVNDSCLCYCTFKAFLWVFRRLCKAKLQIPHSRGQCSVYCINNLQVNLRHSYFILLQKQMLSDFCSLQARDCSTIYNACPLLLLYCNIAYIWRQDVTLSYGYDPLYTLCYSWKNTSPGTNWSTLSHSCVKHPAILKRNHVDKFQVFT